MKRILALLLACVILAGMGAPAFAAAEGSPDNPYKFGVNGQDFNTPKEIPVYGTYDDSGIAPEVYKVTVQWPDMTFKYEVQDNRRWRGASHTYDGSKKSDWVKQSAEIKVTNLSSTNVYVTASYENTDPRTNGLGMHFDGGDTMTLRGGITGTKGEGTFTLMANNAPDPDMLTESGTIEIGTVTITVTTPPAVSPTMG